MNMFLKTTILWGEICFGLLTRADIVLYYCISQSKAHISF